MINANEISPFPFAEPLTKRQKLPEAEPNTKNIGCGGAPESARDAFTDEHIQRIAAETHPFAQFKVCMMQYGYLLCYVSSLLE